MRSAKPGNHLNTFLPIIKKIAKQKLRKLKFFFIFSRESKKYYAKVLPKRFHFNGNTTGFHPEIFRCSWKISDPNLLILWTMLTYIMCPCKCTVLRLNKFLYRGDWTGKFYSSRFLKTSFLVAGFYYTIQNVLEELK